MGNKTIYGLNVLELVLLNKENINNIPKLDTNQNYFTRNSVISSVLSHSKKLYRSKPSFAVILFSTKFHILSIALLILHYLRII